MKVYRQDPLIYRNHFRHQVGGDLPGFKGTRMQYGNGIGSFLGALARKAIPLIKAGVKIAAPHAKKAAKNVARALTGQVVQEVVSRIGHKKRRKPKKRVSKWKNVKRAAAAKDIVLQ